MITRRVTPPPPISRDFPLDTARVRDYTVLPSWARKLAATFHLGAVAVEGLGGDVSKWQEQVNFQTAKDNGWQFAFMRACYGITPDTKFAEHWKAAKGKVKRGLYTYYLDAQDPKQQANAAYNACQGDTGEMPPVLDLEDYGNADLTASRVQDCLGWLTILFDKTPIIYTGKSVWETHFGKTATWGLTYPLWLAQYTLVGWQLDHLNKVLLYPPTLPAPFTKWDFWQCSASCPASNYGVSGSVVDLNYAAPGVLEKYGGTIPPDPTPGEETLMFTNPTEINIRKTAHNNLAKVGTLPKGSVIIALEVRFTDSNSAWVRFTPSPAWVIETVPEYWVAGVHDGQGPLLQWVNPS